MSDKPEPQQATPESSISYITAALVEYASTFPPSVRGPFQIEAMKAVQIIQAALQDAGRL